MLSRLDQYLKKSYAYFFYAWWFFQFFHRSFFVYFLILQLRGQRKQRSTAWFSLYTSGPRCPYEIGHIFGLRLLLIGFHVHCKFFSIVLADFLWAGFVVFMIVQTTAYTKLLFEVSYLSVGLGIEQRWVQILMPAAFCLMMFRIVQVYWRWGISGWKGLPLWMGLFLWLQSSCLPWPLVYPFLLLQE